VLTQNGRMRQKSSREGGFLLLLVASIAVYVGRCDGAPNRLRKLQEVRCAAVLSSRPAPAARGCFLVSTVHWM